MRLLITGAAGNLGSRLARFLFGSPHELRLMIHRRALPFDPAAAIFRSASALTRDFIRIGMASSVADTSRMKKELLPRLDCPTLDEGLSLL